MIEYIKNLFKPKRKSFTIDDQEKFFVWSTVDGPFEDPEGTWTLLVKASIASEMFITELYFSNFNMAYNFHKELMKSSSPIWIELPLGSEVQETEKCLKLQ